MLMGRKQDLIVGYAMEPTVSANAKVIQIDPSAAEIARNRGVDVGIVGDVDAVARQITERGFETYLEGLRLARAAQRTESRAEGDAGLPGRK